MKIVIPGPPIPKARQRTFMRGGKSMSWDPQQQEKFECRHLFQKALRKAFNSKNKEIVMEASNLASGKSFHISIQFYLPIANSATEAERNAKLWGFELCNKKPDCSNMLKFYEDAANQVLFEDDSMIVSGDFKKIFDKNPRTEIEIMTKEEVKLNPKAEGILKIFGPHKVEEFLNDIQTICSLHADKMEEDKTVPLDVRLTATACHLSDFAIKYADLLKKIRKYDGVIEEVGEDELLSREFVFSMGKTLC